ncbi:MAG: protein phosphatase 2C domain-containing protein [Campylobacterales bacterium]
MGVEMVQLGRLEGKVLLEWGTTPATEKVENQDWVGGKLIEGGGVGILCDGVGGLKKGGEGARLVGEFLIENLSEAPTKGELVRLVLEAHSQLNRLNWEVGEILYATTIVGVVLTGDVFFGINVGDSRCYLLSPTSTRQLSVDDHYPELPNLLSQTIGDGSPLNLHQFEGRLEPRELLLLVSDGVYNLFPAFRGFYPLLKERGPIGIFTQIFNRWGEFPDNASLLTLQWNPK